MSGNDPAGSVSVLPPQQPDRFRKTVEQHLRHLHSDDPIRKLAEYALIGEAPPNELWTGIYNSIWSSSLRWHERYVAAWALSHIPVEGEQKDNAILAIFQASHGVTICTKAQAWTFSIGSLGLLAPFILAASLIGRSRALKIDEVALYSLGRLHAYKGLDSAVWALTLNKRDSFPISSQLRGTAVTAFLQIAPEIGDSLYGYVDQKTLKGLGQLLSDEQPEVVLTTLNLVETIGDKSILPKVMACRLAGDIDEARINQVINRIEERSRRAKEAKTLVRPVVTNTLAENALVRPATDVVQPTEQLLRPQAGADVSNENVPSATERLVPTRLELQKTSDEEEHVRELVNAWLVNPQGIHRLRDLGYAVRNSSVLTDVERSRLRKAISMPGHYGTWDICFACWLAGYVDWADDAAAAPLKDLRANAFTSTPHVRRYAARLAICLAITSIAFFMLHLVFSVFGSAILAVCIAAKIMIDQSGSGSQPPSEISIASISSLGHLKDLHSLPALLTKLLHSEREGRAYGVCFHAAMNLIKVAKADPAYRIPVEDRRAFRDAITSLSNQTLVLALIESSVQLAPDDETLIIAKEFAATGWTRPIRTSAQEAATALEIALGRKPTPHTKDAESG